MTNMQERFQRWLDGLPAGFHDPAIRNRLIVAPTILGATLDSPTITGIPVAPSATPGTVSNQLATTELVRASVAQLAERFTMLMQVAGQVIAGTTANTFLFSSQAPVLVVGGSSATPVNTFFVDTNELPDIVALSPRMRVRAQVVVNAVAPTSSFTVGLYPITAVAGGSGVMVYSVGPVVPGSQTTTLVAPAANSLQTITGSEFALPPAGIYAVGLLTAGTVAATSHIHISAQLRRTYVQP